jgi:hypothetical protein
MPVERHILIGGVERGPVTLDGEAGLAVPGIFFLLGQQPTVGGHHKNPSKEAGFYTFRAFYQKKNRLFSYIITPSDKKSKPETKNVFPAAKVFLSADPRRLQI